MCLLRRCQRQGKGPAVFMITGETRRRGISRHETKIRGIRCNKQTDLELIYEIPDFFVRGNGPSDDFLYCGLWPFVRASGAGRFHRRGKGWHEDSGRYPADPGGTSGVGGSPQGIRFSGFSGRAAADACGPSAHTSPNCACGPGASGIQLSSHRAGAGHI